MNEETKKRITDINSGIIPEGYKKTKVGIVPVEWEECHFKKMFSILKNNTLSRAELNNENGNYQNIHYGDILTEYNTILDCSKVHIPFVNYEINVNTDTLINGDIVIADTAEDYTVGKLIEIQNIDNKKIVSGLHTIPCRPNKKTIPKWLGYYMDSFAFHNQLIPLITGTKVSSISKSELQKTVLVSPPLPEQQKIAEILSTQDKLIELQERKIEQLKTLKKGYLQKMFPKKGCKYPELRFKGFTDAWEERELGECADLLTGYPFESKSFSSEGILLIRGMNVKRNQLDCSPDLCEYWHTIEGLEKYLLAENDILIQMDGALIGKSYAKMPKNLLPALLVQRVTRARITKNTVNTDFIYQCIQRNFLSYIKAIKTETAVPHLSLSDIEKFPIFLPTTAEQEAIGSYLRNLDHLITLHQRKLDEEKQKKKALMQLLLTGKVRVK